MLSFNLNTTDLIICLVVLATVIMAISAIKSILKAKPKKNNSTSASRIQNDLIGRKRK